MAAAPCPARAREGNPLAQLRSRRYRGGGGLCSIRSTLVERPLNLVPKVFPFQRSQLLWGAAQDVIVEAAHPINVAQRRCGDLQRQARSKRITPQPLLLHIREPNALHTAGRIRGKGKV